MHVVIFWVKRTQPKPEMFTETGGRDWVKSQKAKSRIIENVSGLEDCTTVLYYNTEKKNKDSFTNSGALSKKDFCA